MDIGQGILAFTLSTFKIGMFFDSLDRELPSDST